MIAPRVFTRVLAGTDGSERAQEAVRQAARLAAATDAPLEIAFVIDTGRPHDHDVEQEAEAVLEGAVSVAKEAGAQAEPSILAGDPARTLIAEAEEDGADLLAVGPDAGLLGGAIRIGRTAAHVLREATCSVLVARPASLAFPTKVACGVDGSEASTRTAVLAADIAAATQAELALVHVIPVFRGDSSEWTLEPDETNPPELEPAVRAVRERGVEPLREMAMGRPEDALVKVTQRVGADLLVVGYRGVRGVRKMLLGSVSEHAAHHAPCSVLVARLASA